MSLRYLLVVHDKHSNYSEINLFTIAQFVELYSTISTIELVWAGPNSKRHQYSKTVAYKSCVCVFHKINIKG